MGHILLLTPVEGLPLFDKPIESSDNFQHWDIGIGVMGKHCQINYGQNSGRPDKPTHQHQLQTSKIYALCMNEGGHTVIHLQALEALLHPFDQVLPVYILGLNLCMEQRKRIPRKSSVVGAFSTYASPKLSAYYDGRAPKSQFLNCATHCDLRAPVSVALRSVKTGGIKRDQAVNR